jgi:hypothetical protein
LEQKGGTIVCPEDSIESNLLNEVREVMYNEEFRTVLRRNLFSLDHGDIANRLADDLCQCLKTQSLDNSLQKGVLHITG